MTHVFKFKSICTNMQPINTEHVCCSRIWIMAYFDRCKITISRFCFSDNKYCKYVFAWSFMQKFYQLVWPEYRFGFRTVFNVDIFNNQTKSCSIIAHPKIDNIPITLWNYVTLRIFIILNGTLIYVFCVKPSSIIFHTCVNF